MLSFISISFFLNKLIIRGFKLKLFHIVWAIFIELKFRLLQNPTTILYFLSLRNLPWFRLLPKHLAGKKYWIPVKIPFQKSNRDFWKFLVKSAKQRLETTFYLRILGEILDTYNSRSSTVRLLEERYKLVYENRQNYRLLFI